MSNGQYVLFDEKTLSPTRSRRRGRFRNQPRMTFDLKMRFIDTASRFSEESLSFLYLTIVPPKPNIPAFRVTASRPPVPANHQRALRVWKITPGGLVFELSRAVDEGCRNRQHDKSSRAQIEDLLPLLLVQGSGKDEWNQFGHGRSAKVAPHV